MGLDGATSSGSHLLTVKTREGDDGAMIAMDDQTGVRAYSNYEKRGV